MTVLTIDQALTRAKSHRERGEVEDARHLLEAVLEAFPNHSEARKDLEGVKALLRCGDNLNPPQEVIDRVLSIYKSGQLLSAFEEAKVLTTDYPGAFVIWNIMGAAAAQLEMLDEAINAFEKVISLKPDYADGYNNLGNALKMQGKSNEAIKAFNQAIEINPEYVDPLYNLGIVFKDQDRLDEAVKLFNRVIRLKPDYAKAYNNMGLALLEQGKPLEALAKYNKALELKPDYSEAYANLGNALADMEKFKDALDAYSKSLILNPSNADTLFNIGTTLKAQGRVVDAITSYKEAIKIQPDHFQAFNNLGNAYREVGDDSAALDAYYKAIKFAPDYFQAYNNLGTLLRDSGKLDDAVSAYNKALDLKPLYVEAYSNLGNALRYQGCLEDGIASYKKALSINPNYAGAHRNLGFALLNIGKTEEGLEEFEWRWQVPENLEARRHFSKPAWDGKKSLKGKRILLWSEQGIGDTLLWSCFIPLVSSQADHCILECQEKLVPLLMRSHPDITVQPENREFDASRDDFDFHLPMGSLYRQLFSKISQQSTTNAFLIPDPARVNYWKERLQSLGDGPYVGIGWKSSKMLPNRMPNYAPLSDWAPLLTLPEVTFINLQYTDFVDDLNSVKSDLGVKVHNFEDLDLLNDIDDVAALCSALDMVVATTSAIPLISAGVGTLTKFACWKQSSWNNPLFQPRGSQLDIFYRNTWDPWEPVFGSIAEDIANS